MLCTAGDLHRNIKHGKKFKLFVSQRLKKNVAPRTGPLK